MRKTLSVLGKLLVTFICMFAMIMIIDNASVRADSGETVRVSTAKELKAAIKKADVGTVIFRTYANISVTIKSAAGAKNKELIVDAPNATVTNKAVFSRINIISVNDFIEKVSGNEIIMSGSPEGYPAHLTVAAKKKVKKLYIFDSYGSFYDHYTLKKGAKLKDLSLIYNGNTEPVENSGSVGKKKLTIKYTTPYDNTCSQKITLDASGRISRVISDSNSVESTYDYSFTYDENGNIIKQAGYDNDGGKFTTTYIYSGDILQKTIFDGQWASSESEYTFDKKGRLILQEITQEDSIDGIVFTTTWTIRNEYDKKGRLINVKNDELTHYVNGTYDDYSSSRVITYAYDAGSFVLKKQNIGQYPTYEYNYTYEYEYNKAGDLIRETITSYDDGSSDPEVEIHEYTYDEFGGLLDQN